MMFWTPCAGLQPGRQLGGYTPNIEVDPNKDLTFGNKDSLGISGKLAGDLLASIVKIRMCLVLDLEFFLS